MIGAPARIPGQLERELAYYHRECNDLGARLLRLQEEQSAAFREARRSRVVAKLIREAYRLADAGSSPEEIGSPMLGVIVENVMCDGAAFLIEHPLGSGRFTITDAVGIPRQPDQETVVIPDPPAAFFTTSRTASEPPAAELTALLQLPFVLWTHDRATGFALILGNRSESNVNRAFEAGDQELIEGALSVYLDVRSRKQSELDLRQAKTKVEESNSLKAAFFERIAEQLAEPLHVISRDAARLRAGSLDEDGRERCASHIADASTHLLSLIDELLGGHNRPTGTVPPPRFERLPLAAAIDGAARAQRGLAQARQVALLVEPIDPSVGVRADRDAMKRLLGELLGDAVRAAPPNGVVLISAGRDIDGQVGIAIQNQDASGRPAHPAPPPALSASGPTERGATEPAPPSDDPNPVWRGWLGSPALRRLVEAQGGDLLLETHPDRGTVIKATFPDPARGPAEGPIEPPPP